MKLIHIKSIIVFLIGITIITTSCVDENKKNQAALSNNEASISGEIIGNSTGNTISITEINNDLDDLDDLSIKTLATTKLKNGKFSFDNIEIKSPRAVKLTFDDSINTVVFLEPGVINVKINTKDTIFTEMFEGIELRAKRTGSINNELFTQYRDQRHNILRAPEFSEIRVLDKIMFAIDIDFDALNKLSNNLSKKISKRDDKLSQLKKDFILNNNDKMASLYVLLYEDFRFDDIFSPNEIVSFFNNYSKDLDGNKYYEQVKHYVTNSRNSAVGMTLEDFSLKNRNNENISLSSFKGKYVFIDFWAYWCKPCVAAFPHLEKLRKKYKNEDFEILGISSDPNHEQWIKALNKHKPSWIQVIDTDDKIISKRFNIAKLPTTFLIDKQGTIIAIDLYEKDLDAELKAIFGH